jgi:lipoic acid synthetase
LDHVVVTSVTRDDLGGADQFAAIIEALRRRLPRTAVKVLNPDFRGSCVALERVLAAGPHVLNHSLETVPWLYPEVRPGADYRRSLGLLAHTKARSKRVRTKSGLGLALGERVTEVLEVFRDLRRTECDTLTLGQYLQPTDRQLPVACYVSPDEFRSYRDMAERMGFRSVTAGPLVCSSYRGRTRL